MKPMAPAMECLLFPKPFPKLYLTTSPFPGL